MNAKKCKELRRSLRKGGVDCTEAKHMQRMVKDKDGVEKRHSTAFLDPKCGRAIYQQLKRKA
jgi:hypothetical protein